MAIEKKEIDYAKETGDVMVLTHKLIKTIKEKGDYTAVLPELIQAINGADQIDDEAKASKEVVAATVSYHLGEIAGLFV